MNERPTPETDAAERMAFAQEYMVPTEFARQLARERDEARDKCAFWIQEWRGLRDLCRKLNNEARDLLRERDEAREQLEIIKSNQNNSIAEFSSSSNTPETDAACHEIYAQGVAHIPLVGFMEKLERERDEAQAALDEIEKYGTEEINAAVDLRCQLAAALIERDEAREPLDFFDATNAFIDAALQRYAYRNDKDADLTQVFMRGPFAGWSERQVVELIRQLDENRNLHRLEP